MLPAKFHLRATTVLGEKPINAKQGVSSLAAILKNRSQQILQTFLSSDLWSLHDIWFPSGKSSEILRMILPYSA